MATFQESAVHSVSHMLSLLCLFVVLVVSHLGFKGMNFVLIAPLTFTFGINILYIYD